MYSTKKVRCEDSLPVHTPVWSGCLHSSGMHEGIEMALVRVCEQIENLDRFIRDLMLSPETLEHGCVHPKGCVRLPCDRSY